MVFGPSCEYILPAMLLDPTVKLTDRDDAAASLHGVRKPDAGNDTGQRHRVAATSFRQQQLNVGIVEVRRNCRPLPRFYCDLVPTAVPTFP